MIFADAMGPEDEELEDDAAAEEGGGEAEEQVGGDDAAYADTDEAMDAELAELLKPEPLSFPDDYAAAANKPVSLDVPVREYAFTALGKTTERRFPAKQVAKSAAALAKTLKSRSKP
ncbi:MAG: hypothetical protein JNK82_40675 [Myxococcaceae bacterium]|nr:hypothetical protein [Myxococcaceae bacterium]